MKARARRDARTTLHHAEKIQPRRIGAPQSQRAAMLLGFQANPKSQTAIPKGQALGWDLQANPKSRKSQFSKPKT